MSPAAYLSFRLSIRWLPKEASEPTDTIVLTGARTGVFLDARFFKDTGKLDWAFAGYRSTDADQPNVIKFRHDIDSRTLDQVEDSGTNTTLPDGTTLEVGEMIDPHSGKMTPFEEIWKDEEEEDGETVLFLRNATGTKWQARVGKWQMAMGRDNSGIFWAWQAEKHYSGRWIIKHSTGDIQDEKVVWLPEKESAVGRWVEGSTVEWQGENWVVLERGCP